jgi:hypothetical protein
LLLFFFCYFVRELVLEINKKTMVHKAGKSGKGGETREGGGEWRGVFFVGKSGRDRGCGFWERAANPKHRKREERLHSKHHKETTPT